MRNAISLPERVALKFITKAASALGEGESLKDKTIAW
jgi:hypothetical protein